MTDKRVRIGCYSGFWGDSPHHAAQLVRKGDIDYLVGDYLSEITLSLLARARQRHPELGYTPDFITALAPLLPEIHSRGIRVIVNAGGVNPRGCRDALDAEARRQGVALPVAVVEGDDLMPQLEAVRAAEPREMFSQQAFPQAPASMNAYLGAWPIKAALDAGARVVITGRCVDSALALGALLHEFNWPADDWTRLAMGSLAGHVIECGCQATGGLFTDWREVPGWDDMGLPIAECRADGGFNVAKPAGTGGLVSCATVAEQILYEIDNPRTYVLPDVVCDLSGVRLEQEGPNRVRVEGAVGRPATPDYKTCATWQDGWRVLGTLMIGGFEAEAKARRTAHALIARTRRLMKEQGIAVDFADISVEVLGTEDTYGRQRRIRDPREVILKIGLRHEAKAALDLFAGELTGAVTAMAPGTTGYFAGRPRPQPVLRLFSFLYPKALVPVRMDLEGRTRSVAVPPGQLLAPVAPARGDNDGADMAGPLLKVPLRAIAHARSGDKGDRANIGVIARRPEYAGLIRDQVTGEVVARYFSHLLRGQVTRHEAPGLYAFNFVLDNALGGGGIASLRYDPQGKAYGQMLLDLDVTVPAAWAETDERIRELAKEQ